MSSFGREYSVTAADCQTHAARGRVVLRVGWMGDWAEQDIALPVCPVLR